MNDTFRLTVHWAERIVEFRCPERPTLPAWERCAQEIKTSVMRLGFGWKVLVDDSAISELSDETAKAVGQTILWANDNGMVMAARVTTPNNVVDTKLRAVPGLMRAAGVPFKTRDEAWAALLAAPNAAPSVKRVQTARS